MPTDDQANANPDEQAQELGEEVSSLQENTPSSGDPFDGMTHEQIVAEAKKLRAIMQRNTKPKEAKAQPTATAPLPTDALTKKDFWKINNDRAREMLKADPEMSKFADAITENYVNRRGQDSPDAIFEDLKDALAVVKFRTPAKAEDPAAALQTTSYVRPSSPRPQSQEAKKSIIPKKETIDQWYKKK